MSAPCSNGRHRYGEAKVLSMISGRLCFVGDVGDGADVEHVGGGIADGLAVEQLGLRRHGAAEVLRV